MGKCESWSCHLDWVESHLELAKHTAVCASDSGISRVDWHVGQ